MHEASNLDDLHPIRQDTRLHTGCCAYGVVAVLSILIDGFHCAVSSRSQKDHPRYHSMQVPVREKYPLLQRPCVAGCRLYLLFPSTVPQQARPCCNKPAQHTPRTPDSKCHPKLALPCCPHSRPTCRTAVVLVHASSAAGLPTVLHTCLFKLWLLDLRTARKLSCSSAATPSA